MLIYTDTLFIIKRNINITFTLNIKFKIFTSYTHLFQWEQQQKYAENQACQEWWVIINFNMTGSE